MKIKIQKSNDKYLLLLGDDERVDGYYLSKSDLKKLKSDVNDMLEYDQDEVGDSL